MTRKTLFVIFLVICGLAINAHVAYSNKTDAETAHQIPEITAFTKSVINKALRAARNRDKKQSYKDVAAMVDNDFDNQHMLKFCLSRTYKKLDGEQKEYLEAYSKRSLILMFLEKFIFKSLSYEITKVVENSKTRVFDVYLVIRSVEGLQVDKLAKDIKGESDETKNDAKNKDIEVVLSVKSKGSNKYVLQDLKAMDMSFLNSMRNFYQKTLQESGDDIDVMIDALITSLEMKEKQYRTRNNIPESYFPPIRTLLEL